MEQKLVLDCVLFSKEKAVALRGVASKTQTYVTVYYFSK